MNWTNTTVQLKDLKPWKQNPRQSTKKQAKRILESFDKFGQVQVIAIGPNNEVYDGHQRLSALLTIHGPEYKVDARRCDRELSDVERQSLVITLHAGAKGEWDWDMLANWDIEALMDDGMNAEFLKELKSDTKAMEMLLKANQPETEDVEPEIDKAEELREKWGVELGQMWQLGDHRIICGDCTDASVVARVMGGEKAAICFTSPPYNAGVSAKLSGNTHIGDNLYGEQYNDNKTQDEYFDLLQMFTDKSLECCNYVFTNIQLLAGNKLALTSYQSYYSDKLCDVMIWDKGHAAPQQAQRVLNSRFEYIYIFGGNGSRAIGTREFRGNVDNVYNGKPQRDNNYASIHAATMPLDLPEYIIKTFTNDSDIVYEPFSGSGTTIIACENLGRKCRAIELSPAYVAVAIERWHQLTGQDPVML